jgi:hypothetical protein
MPRPRGRSIFFSSPLPRARSRLQRPNADTPDPFGSTTLRFGLDLARIMLPPINFRLDATTPVAGPAAVVRAREVREPRPIQAGDGAGSARSRTPGEQAAIVNFGTGAIQLAQDSEEASASEAEGGEPEGGEAEGDAELSSDERRAVADMQRRDREVRTHEQTHRSVGGQYAGSIHLDYQVGPDGQRYAVAGTTAIDASPVANDPEATLRKMQIVQRAATAPVSPSGADRQVASAAAHQAQQARAELAATRYGGRPGEPRDAAPGRLLEIRV